VTPTRPLQRRCQNFAGENETVLVATSAARQAMARPRRRWLSADADVEFELPGADPAALGDDPPPPVLSGEPERYTVLLWNSCTLRSSASTRRERPDG
jgi:hypothetical protein